MNRADYEKNRREMVDYANTYIYEIATLQYLSSITKLSSATPLHLFRSGGC
jgi:hypothetical protein